MPGRLAAVSFILAALAGMACGSSTSHQVADGGDGPSAADANPMSAPAGDSSADGSTFIDTVCGCPSGSVAPERRGASREVKSDTENADLHRGLSWETG